MKRTHSLAGWLIALLTIWALSAAIDIFWLWLDRSVPSWDPADHLIGSLNYWWSLENANWLSADWWHGVWTLSSKYPPLLYISTAPILSVLGTGADQAALVNVLFSGVLLLSIFGIGKHLLDAEVATWAAGICLLLPRFYSLRTEYFMDYPLVALVAASFYALTLWRDEPRANRQWVWALLFGAFFGLALLTKQSALFFLAIPLGWSCLVAIWHRRWGRLWQLAVAGALAIAFILPWLSTNWLFQISAGFNANVKSAISEGDPSVNTLAAWLYYWADLPKAVSWVLLIVPIVGLLLSLSGAFDRFQPKSMKRLGAAIGWLAVFWLGAYLLWTLILNKDTRYVMPYLPIVAIALGYGLTRWPRRWWWVRWATIAIAVVAMMLNLFPIGGSLGPTVAATVSPQAIHQPYTGSDYPHQAVVDEIVRVNPYQIVNLGLLHSTATVNQHNFTYYGNQRDFRVYARRIGNNDDYLEQDVRSLSWILTQTGSREPSESPKTRRQRAKVRRLIQQSREFERHAGWDMPDGSRLVLFKRRQLPVEVTLLDNLTAPSATPIQLEQVQLPSAASTTAPIPVTYTWSGSWAALHSGNVLITWKPANSTSATPSTNSAPRWLHDHGIGLGTLYPQPIQANQFISPRATVDPQAHVRVVERMAMQPPPNLPDGVYTLEVSYMNRDTGEVVSIKTPTVQISLSQTAIPAKAPEVDWVSQLRTQAIALPQGLPALDAIFAQLGQLNLYDPVQNYLVQAEETLSYRLQQDPQNRDYAYGLALSRVMQRKVEPAIAALQEVVRLDPNNSNAYAYLGFVNLYALRPVAARTALTSALALQPNSIELHALNGLAALMQGNLIAAWKEMQVVLNQS